VSSDEQRVAAESLHFQNMQTTHATQLDTHAGVCATSNARRRAAANRQADKQSANAQPVTEHIRALKSVLPDEQDDIEVPTIDPADYLEGKHLRDIYLYLTQDC
jgi:hypothetical protein